MAVTAKIGVLASGEHTVTVDLGTSKRTFVLPAEFTFTSGTGAGQVDRVFADERTLAASANEDLDLAAGLTDAFGAAITFATIKAVIIIAAAGNTNNVNVTRPASNGFPLFMAAGDGIALEPGAAFVYVRTGTGKTVTASTGDLLNIANSGGTTGVTYQVLLLGVGA